MAGVVRCRGINGRELWQLRVTDKPYKPLQKHRSRLPGEGTETVKVELKRIETIGGFKMLDSFVGESA
jgi:hypothetical protein